ncbi:protein-disulfide reductase DsbD family protein [Leptospira noguchii]|uniref:Cytochrome C biogenesis protein transmembrane region n=3 Tax=Leptospira noguchii TaxID=28182 RepID=M6Y874_9LEPT|nr:cytochrome c biogenesis protein CcdA [Leptospira noguchii]EKR74875.1 cytochrome C biogenesis protein transmembrane region [Leptospira noguchii str. 2006001870]EMN02262.1 cytochrome C biogenesis protein transmembrane region [Leptospira noguchii str. 2007001578]EMO90512.1 cytochrome C biogenesis protein transmembrane region [Leptospira noguchii str. 2001034031]EMS83655.1 cytochrome C biogenesis protein transmembrane region [Leptospira noguchii str. Hook]EMS88648.1 cytochrome C biogenesis prot
MVFLFVLSKILIYKNSLIRFVVLNICFFGFVFTVSAEAVSESLRKTVVEGISGEGPTTGLVLVMGGILASLLPCVYPLYPITVGIVRARGEGSPKILHPAIYYLGLVVTYSCFGLIAGFSGGAFNVVLRYPIVNLGLSILIFLLALGSLDLIHLPLFKSKEVKTIQGCGGTFLLGMGAGLLSSPCVGPVVVAILLQITAGAGAISIGSVFLASFKMFLFGIGLGFPFLIIGVFGLSLPKSGKWMRWVQWILGIFVLYFSYTYFQKSLSGWGIPDSSIPLAAFGILILLFCLYFFLPDEWNRYVRMKKALFLGGVVLSAVGLMVLLTYSLAGGNSTSVVEMETKGNLSWHRIPSKAYAEGTETGKKVFIDFYADWCTNCKTFEELTQNDSALNDALQSAVLLKIKDQDPIFETYAKDPRFEELKIGLPFFVILDANGNLLYKNTDYQDTSTMIQILKQL